MKAITTRYTVRRERAGYVASDGDGNSVFVQSNDALKAEGIEERHRAACLALCAKMGWKGDLVGGHVLKARKTIGMVWVWKGEQSYRARAR